MFQFIEKLKGGAKVKYESTRIPYTLRRYYVPDFVCERSDGSVFYIEVKGYLRSTDRSKLLAVKEAAPMADVRLVFAKDNLLYASSKTRYSEWCIKHGFQYSIGSVPKHWFQGSTRVRRSSISKDVLPRTVFPVPEYQPSTGTSIFSRDDANYDPLTKETQ